VRLADFLGGTDKPPSPLPLQLDEIVLRVVDVDRYALALGAKARADFPTRAWFACRCSTIWSTSNGWTRRQT
jgi:hypothetical protein